MRSWIPGSAMANPAGGDARRPQNPARSLLFRTACGVLGAVVLLGIAAEWVAPYSPTAVDAQGLFQARADSTGWEPTDSGATFCLACSSACGCRWESPARRSRWRWSAGSALGLLAGLGRGLDQVCGRVMDVFFAFPPILLAIAIAAILGAGVGSAIAAIAVVYAPLFFRVVRSSVLAESVQAYVEAAEALGLGRGAILLRHIVPNAVSPVIVQTAVCLSYGILIESALSYLGVGVQPPTPSWGTILNEGKEFLALAPWVSLFPGGAIMLTVLALNVVGDGLRDSLDPRAVTR